MRVSSSVTSVSWIPSESVTGSVYRVPFELGFCHYDDPPPDQVADPYELIVDDRVRFVNHLRAWVEVDDGRVVDHGHEGRGGIGSTTMRLGGRGMTFAAVPLPDRRRTEQLAVGAVRFEQTAGGRTGVPAPRKVGRSPYVQLFAPLAWTTLRLTLFADGREEFELLGASPFPRHWVYDKDGRLAAKSATIDYRHWSNDAFGRHTPWGEVDSPALATEVETALERELSARVMRGGARPEIRRLAEGDRLTVQGERSEELFVLLDGLMRVEVDGTVLAELGPGAVVGERAILEGGRRTATLTAATASTVAAASRETIDTDSLRALSGGHRREELT